MKIKQCILISLVLALLAMLPISTSAAINDGLYSYYTFDEDAVDIFDNNSLALKRDGQIVKEGSAAGSGHLSMTGKDDVLALVAMDAYGPYFDTDEMTIALWVRLDTAKETGWGTIVGFGTGANYDYFRYMIDYGNSTMSFYFQSTNLTYTIDYPEGEELNLKDGEWHHIGFTAKMDYAPVFYVDGVAYEDDVDITQFIGDPNGGYFVLGAMNDLTTDVYQGDMDDFRIYTRALSGEEFAELYAMKGTTPVAPETTTTEPVTNPPDDTDDIVDSTADTAAASMGQAEDTNDTVSDTAENTGSTSDDENSNGWIIWVAVAVAVVVVAVVAIVVIKKKKN